MQKVKIIYSTRPSYVEDLVDAWLKKNPQASIISVKNKIHENADVLTTIIYEIINPENELLP